jgi:hypothetical protein
VDRSLRLTGPHHSSCNCLPGTGKGRLPAQRRIAHGETRRLPSHRTRGEGLSPHRGDGLARRGEATGTCPSPNAQRIVTCKALLRVLEYQGPKSHRRGSSGGNEEEVEGLAPSGSGTLSPCGVLFLGLISSHGISHVEMLAPRLCNHL